MRTFHSILIFCVALMLQPRLHAQWVSTTGNFGSIVGPIVVNDTNVFVGTQNGVFRSANNGHTWTAVNCGLPTVFDVQILATHGPNLFVSGDSGGLGTPVYRSSNGGASWTLLNFDRPWNCAVCCFAFSGRNVFAGTWGGGGVYRSTDGGENWAAIDSGIVVDTTDDQQSVNVLTVSGTNLFAGTSWGGILVSTDNGSSWNATGLKRANVNTLAVSPNGDLFAITDIRDIDGYHYGGSMFLSTDDGVTWTDIDSGLGNNWAVTLSAVPNGSGGANLFVGTGGRGVFLSTDNGATWAPAGLSHTYITALATSPNGGDDTRLFAGTFSGNVLERSGDVFFSTDNGKNWTTSTLNTTISALAMSPNGPGGPTLYAVASMVFLSSTNGGANWTATGFPKMTFTPPLAVIPSSDGEDSTNIFVGIDSVFLSTDNGASWSVTADSGLTNTTVSSLATCGARLYAGTGSGVFLSANNGASWAPVPGLPNSDVTSFVESGSNQFIGTNAGVFLSTDDGTSWSAVNTGLKNLNVNALAVIDTNLFAGTNGNGVFLSTNNGTSWHAAGLKGMDVCAFAVIGTNLFAGASTGGVYLTTDNGLHWSSVNTGLANTTINTFVQNGKDIFAGTGSGIWRRPLSEMITGVSFNQPDMPAKYELEQNYPNPFNPTTMITYRLSAVSKATLKVYDMLGRLVTTLIDGRQTPGEHSIIFDAKRLSSGVYFYQLRAGDFTETKKMLVEK